MIFDIKFNRYNKNYIKRLKKYKLIILDEFQVTNIVDAMILGKFLRLFSNMILKFYSSNIDIDDIYKDGLQREQFLPFIALIKEHSLKRRLDIGEDYRKLASQNSQRVLFPLNETPLKLINFLEN